MRSGKVHGFFDPQGIFWAKEAAGQD